ncbi:hypothetical protein DCS_04160 [Drechmeria coniospora]|uniref:CFEM domain-containing protein n=1 Tax=Drechmeria coniospora TaxID=98403 RepID=A0A151GJ52_DRECN|nr:hypothetical protein DCS_04160 [Drechmeria coniospora]KYK57153.1 hypothetical protein DCS_04160 [Drechmeria coniospora]ODA79060.1 hypothetical protein RJ55_04651 [Drechmeria coniospora]
MKFTAVATVAMAALVSAADIPDCAKPCILDAAKAPTTNCEGNYACICKNIEAVRPLATGCVIKACSDKIAQVLKGIEDVCKEALSAPPAASGPASSAAATGVASTSVAASVPASSPASKPSTPQASATATHAATAVSSVDCSTTLAPSVTPHKNTTVPTTSAIVTAGAAGLASVGGLAMLALGALAL